jgi:hypothetical protein
MVDLNVERPGRRSCSLRTASAGLLAWVVRTRKAAAEAPPARATRPRDRAASPVIVSGGQGVQVTVAQGNVQNDFFGLSEARWAGPAFAFPTVTGREVIRPALLAQATAALLGRGLAGRSR